MSPASRRVAHGHDSVRDKLMSILLGIAAVLAVIALILGWMWVDGTRMSGASFYLHYLSSVSGITKDVMMKKQ